MANSYTGSISTDGIYKSIAEVTEFTFTIGKTYAIQLQNLAYVKISNAEFVLQNEKFYYTATADGIDIKTNGYVTLTILEL